MSIKENDIEQIEKLNKYKNIQLFDKYAVLLLWATLLGIPTIAIIDNAYVHNKTGSLGIICLLISLSPIISLIIRLKITHWSISYLSADINKIKQREYNNRKVISND
jgi:hypothetical protein